MQKKNRKGVKKMHIFLIVIGVIVVIFGGMFGGMMLQNGKVPQGLGVTDGQLAPMPTSPNAVSSQSTDEAYYVEPFAMKADVQQTKEAFLKASDAYGKYELYKEEANYLHLVFITSTMGYRDDVEIHIDEERGLVHFRSASRVGYSDMGLNRARYEAIRAIYEK